MDRSGLSCLRYSSVPRLLLCINGALECSWALRTPYPHHCCVKRGSLILSGLQILLWGPDCVETGKPTHRRLTGPLFVFCTLSCACTHTHTHTHTSGWLPMALQSQVSAGVYCKQRRGLSGYFPRHIQAWWKKKKRKVPPLVSAGRINAFARSQDRNVHRECKKKATLTLSCPRCCIKKPEWNETRVSCFQLSSPPGRSLYSKASLPVDYYTVAEQTWPNENSDLLLSSPVREPGREQFPNCCFAALLCQPATLSLNDKHTVLFSGDPAELQESVGLRIKTHTQMIVCQVLVHKSSSRNERCGSKASSCSDKNCLCIFQIKPRKSMFWFQIAGYHVRQVLLCLFLSLWGFFFFFF